MLAIRYNAQGWIQIRQVNLNGSHQRGRQVEIEDPVG